MGDDDAAVGALAQMISEHTRDVFVRQPVEAVALDAGLAQRVGQSVGLRDGGLRRMEGGVEARDLAQPGLELGERPDRGQVVRLVQGSQRVERLELAENVGRENDGRRVANAAMHNPVTGGGDLRSGRPSLDPVEDRAERVVMIRARQSFGPELLAVRPAGGEARARAQTVDLAAIA